MIKVILKVQYKENLNEEEMMKFMMDMLELLRASEGFVGVESYKQLTGEAAAISIVTFKQLSDWAKYCETRKYQKLAEKFPKFYRTWKSEIWSESPGGQ